ncbi:hypothetical protein SUDANB176_02839 [Streptomyces sp. enrichment culture]
MAGSPTARRRRLSIELKKLREKSALTCAQVGQSLDWSGSKVNRMETGSGRVQPSDVDALCRFYGTSDELREFLKSLAREAKTRGWWRVHGAGAPEWFNIYIGLEQDASTLRQYRCELLPGLMQTEAYARELHTTAVGRRAGAAGPEPGAVRRPGVGREDPARQPRRARGDPGVRVGQHTAVPRPAPRLRPPPAVCGVPVGFRPDRHVRPHGVRERPELRTRHGAGSRPGPGRWSGRALPTPPAQVLEEVRLVTRVRLAEPTADCRLPTADPALHAGALGTPTDSGGGPAGCGEVPGGVPAARVTGGTPHLRNRKVARRVRSWRLPRPGKPEEDRGKVTPAPITAPDPVEQAALCAEIGGVLADGLPDGWAKATPHWSDLVSSGSMAALAVVDADGGSLTAAGVPKGVDDLCRRLRTGSPTSTGACTCTSTRPRTSPRPRWASSPPRRPKRGGTRGRTTVSAGNSPSPPTGSGSARSPIPGSSASPARRTRSGGRNSAPCHRVRVERGYVLPRAPGRRPGAGVPASARDRMKARRVFREARRSPNRLSSVTAAVLVPERGR